MPLHGKIVVIKRSGGDGTEFPLTASCLFGRKPDCDIRIQLPQVSKEHCRIDLNENKEVMLTNLSLVNPTRINGEAMKQVQHLKHGDVITIIDRSFRFEYPPEPTPKKKRPSLSGKTKTVQVADPVTLVTGERRKSSDLTSESPCLKDGTNTSNVQALAFEDCDDTAKEMEPVVLEQREPSEKESRSPFCELYEMIKENLSVKSPWKPAEATQPRTPLSRCEPGKTVGIKTAAEELVGEDSTPQVEQFTPLPKKITERKRSSVGCVAQKGGEQAESRLGGEVTPRSAKRRSKVSYESSLAVGVASALPAEPQAEDSSQPVATPCQETPKESRHSLETPGRKSVPEEKGTPMSRQGTPQKLITSEVAGQSVSESNVTEDTVQSTGKPKTPKGRRSNGSTGLPCQSSAGTPGTPSRSHSPDSHDVLELQQAQSEAETEMSEAIKTEKSPKAKEAESPRRVSPRKSPGKKPQASDVLLELELTAPPSGGKSAKAGTTTSSGKKRKIGNLEVDLPGPQLKRKRVSFGGQLSPELFDKRLPPNSPLRRGATPGRRSLSVLRQSLLRGASSAGLMEELSFDLPSPKRKTPPCSPSTKASRKPASPANGSPSPAKKSPKSKAKTPSPKKSEVESSLGQKSPAGTPSLGKASPSTGGPMAPKGRKSESPSPKTPRTPSAGKSPGKRLNGSAHKTSPSTSTRTPSEPVLAECGSALSTPPSSTRRRRSVSDALDMSPDQSKAEMSKTPLPAEKAPGSTAKTPSPKGLSVSKCSFNQTPTVKGRFSVSRVGTPSPTADQDTAAVETSACTTPTVPLRRMSMKSASKKTPRSARKSVLEVIRSRRSGASRANLKVVSSWADIVKFGVSKPQTAPTTKKCTGKAITVKKRVVKKLKTPAKKVKDHFSTGHAASPATIVVGKAHTKVAQTAGCVPKIVHNIALLRKNMKVNEDLSGIAEIFRTPAKGHEKSNQTSDSVCPVTPQPASASFTEFSVMDTPEEMGEMVVSPLSVIDSEKQGIYDSEAIAWLLQDDQDSSLSGDYAPQESDALMAPLVTDDPEQEPASKRVMRTPEQKSEPLTCLTGVKRLMKTPKQKAQQVEDFRGIKRLLKTPREPKVSQEMSLIGVKEMMKTPKLKTIPLVCTTGVKRLMKTPKQKNQPVEDMIGVKRLMQTPKQKVESVEDLTGVKQLMKTPKQKGKPVENMIGLKRLMQTPKQKVDPVEDLTGVKQLMQTPKHKGLPIESNFGIRQLMKSPKQKGVPVEDFAGLKELMEEPSDYMPSEVDFKVCESSEEQVSGACPPPEIEKCLPALCEAEIASKEESPEVMHEESESNATKKSVRGKLLKEVEKISEADAKNDDLTNPQCGAEINSASDADQNLPEVKPQQGRQASQVAATAIKRTRQKIAEIKKEPVNSVVATPTKSAGRKGVKNVEESEKGPIEEKLPENVESVKEGGDEMMSSNMEIEEFASVPALDLVPAKGRRGRKPKEINQNNTFTAPARKTGRGKKANLTDGANESNKVVEMSPALKVEDEKLPAPVPIMEPRRGRRPKQANGEGGITVATTAESIVSNTEQSVGDCPPYSAKEDGDELISSNMEIEEFTAVPTLDLVPAKGRRARKPKEIDQNNTFTAPARKTGRGKKANLTDGANESNKIVEMSPALKVEDETLPAPVPIMQPRRGRRPREANGEGGITVATTTESVVSNAEQSVGDCSPKSKEEAPIVKTRRGRRAKAVEMEDQTSVEVLPKRTRRGAVDHSALEKVASPVPSIKSGRGRGRKAVNFDSTEETIPVQADIPPTECSSKSPKKVRGMRRRTKISDTVALDAATPLDDDSVPGTSLSNDLMKNGQGQAITRRKAVSRKAEVNEADKNLEIETSIKNVKRGPAKRSVKRGSGLMSHTSEIEVLPCSEQGSLQGQLISEESTAGYAENGDGEVDETKMNLELPTTSRRGRAGKKSAVQPTESMPVAEHPGPEPKTGNARSTRKGRTQIVKSDLKDDAPLAKRGTKRKLTHKDTDEVPGDSDFASESVTVDSLPKRARGSTVKVEETKLEDKPNEMKRGTAKKAGKTPDNEVEETKPVMETPKPARRGRRNVRQQDEVEPVLVEECPTKGQIESAKQPATRRRAKTEKKADCTKSEEARPVRRTRQK